MIDALETIGLIHFKAEIPQLVMLAMVPITAGHDLKSGEPVGIYNGKAYAARSILDDGPDDPDSIVVPNQGVVDPFLPDGVSQGERFWIILNPPPLFKRTT